MRIWFDTEFYEDGKTIELISIGIAAEDGRTYYAQTPGAHLLARQTEWLTENVLPHLKPKCKARSNISRDIIEFMGEKPEIWAYYADYDLGGVVPVVRKNDLLAKWMANVLLRCEALCDSVGNPELPKQNNTEHHALSDALWTKQAWYYLQKNKS